MFQYFKRGENDEKGIAERIEKERSEKERTLSEENSDSGMFVNWKIFIPIVLLPAVGILVFVIIRKRKKKAWVMLCIWI